ncbi:MAG TPA: hypothetical protein VMH20_09945 [Verrucomicrobiae bacterium]|nr:hypothetical protein [Verrucomicrobiae bacterium]
MRCPKCQFDHELQSTECLKCGIVFSRYQPAMALPATQAVAALPELPSASLVPAVRDDGARELKWRALALPVALIAARLITGTGLRMAAAMLAMVLHESGHAITAWLTGRWAVPLLWVTPHGEERSWMIVLFLAAAILFGGYQAWKARRWGWLCAAAAALVLQRIVLNMPAGALIIFWGDGGAMVLATMLMACFYAPRESWLDRSWGLRWGLLGIGALSFMHVFRIWTGPLENIPFGEIEGVGPSDPSLLTEMYGWSVTQLVDRYVRLGTVCLVFLGGLYVWGLASLYMQRLRRPSS